MNTYTQPADPAALAVCEQPSNRLAQHGESALSDSELLALVLQGSGMGVNRATVTARNIIAQAGGFAGVPSLLHSGAFASVPGVGEFRANVLRAVLEIARRYITPQAANPKLCLPQSVVEYIRPLTLALEVEKFWVCCLNRKNRLIRCVEMTSGTTNSCLAHPRDVYRVAVRENATAIICAHNHPSGDPAPSAPDMHVTRLLREAARTMEIELLDHVIVGNPSADPTGKGYFSFREAGIV